MAAARTPFAGYARFNAKHLLVRRGVLGRNSGLVTTRQAELRDRQFVQPASCCVNTTLPFSEWRLIRQEHGQWNFGGSWTLLLRYILIFQTSRATEI